MAWPIQNPVVGQLLQRAFGIQGRVRPALEEFVIPTVSLGDLSEGSSPPVTRKAVCVLSQAAVAGELYTVRFEVPGNLIAVIRRLHLQSSVTPNNLRVHFPGNAATIAAQGNTPNKSFTDGRILPGSNNAQLAAGVTTDGTQIAGLATVDTVFRVADELTLINPGWVIGTGQPGVFGFLELQLSVPNTAVVGGIEWDEYQLV